MPACLSSSCTCNKSAGSLCQHLSVVLHQTQDQLASRTGSLSPPVSPFSNLDMQAAAERTAGIMFYTSKSLQGLHSVNTSSLQAIVPAVVQKTSLEQAETQAVSRTGSLSPPLSPFSGADMQAAAERTTAAADGRFSSLQRLSGTASTSQPAFSPHQVIFSHKFGHLSGSV